MKNRFAVASVMVALAPVASAQIVDGVRFGVMDHNIEVTDPKNANKESGININAELRFSSPGFLGLIGSPHPYIMASANTDGNTSFGAVGLEWDWEVLDGWHVEPGFGYAIHDGELELPWSDPADPRRQPFLDKHVLLGSRDLFRSSLGITRDLGERWAVQFLYEHLSHGQILGSGHNQGLDELGVRFAYKIQ